MGGDSVVVEIAVVIECLEVCRAQLHGYDYAKGVDGTDLERAKAIMGAVNFLLQPDLKGRKEVFLETAYLMKQALSLCAALLPERDRFEAGFMEAVRGMINQWTMSGQGGMKKEAVASLRESRRLCYNQDCNDYNSVREA